MHARPLLAAALTFASTAPLALGASPATTVDQAYKATVWFEVDQNCGNEGSTAQGVFVEGDRLLTVLHAFKPGPCLQGVRELRIRLHVGPTDHRSLVAKVVAVDPFRDLVELTVSGYTSPYYLTRRAPTLDVPKLSWAYYDRINEAVPGQGAVYSYQARSTDWLTHVGTPKSGFEQQVVGRDQTKVVPFRKELPDCVKHNDGGPVPTLFKLPQARGVPGHSGSVVWDDQFRLHSMIVLQLDNGLAVAAVEAGTPLPYDVARRTDQRVLTCTLDTPSGSYNPLALKAATSGTSRPDALPWKTPVCALATDLHHRLDGALDDAWSVSITPFVVDETGEFVDAEPVTLPPLVRPESNLLTSGPGIPCKSDVQDRADALTHAVAAADALLMHLSATRAVWNSVLAAVAAPPVCFRSEGQCLNPRLLPAFTCPASGSLPTAADWDAQWRWINWGPIAAQQARQMCGSQLNSPLCEAITCDLLEQTDAEGLLGTLALFTGPVTEDVTQAVHGLFDLLETSCPYGGWISPFDQIAIGQACQSPAIMTRPTSDPGPLCQVYPALHAAGVTGQLPLDCADPASVADAWAQIMPHPPEGERWADLGVSAVRLAELEQRVVEVDLVDPIKAVAGFIHVQPDDFARYGDRLRDAPWQALVTAIEALPVDPTNPDSVERMQARLPTLDALLHGPDALPMFDDTAQSTADQDGPSRLRTLIRAMLAHHADRAAGFHAPGCDYDDCRRIAWAREAYARRDGALREASLLATDLHALLNDWAH